MVLGSFHWLLAVLSGYRQFPVVIGSSQWSSAVRFLRPNVLRKDKTVAVAVHAGDASPYHTASNEEELKKHIRAKGGQTNVALAFLKDTSQDTAVQPRKNGKTKKCWIVPHDALPEELLRQLYTGDCLGQPSNFCPIL